MLFIFEIEHLFLFLIIILKLIIPFAPRWVRLFLKRRESLQKQRLKQKIKKTQKKMLEERDIDYDEEAFQRTDDAPTSAHGKIKQS